MKRDVRRLAEMAGQIVVERQDELSRFDEWFADRDSATVVCSVNGFGGIGKTTFLGQIAERAHRHRIQTARVDGFLGFASAVSLLSYLCEQVGLGGVRETEPIPEAMGRLSHSLSEQRTVLLFDHFDEMASLESFVRTELIPRLPVNGVLLVLASRGGLSMGWRTDPALITRILWVTLNNLTWQQSMDYVRRAGIEDSDLQQRLSRETSGYPLSLALAVQSALHEFSSDEDATFSVHEISARLIREVAPHLNDLVEGLSFLRISTQDVLNRVLQKEVSLEDFRALARLSFVRVTGKGLAVHDVVRAYLLSELKVRHPQKFDALFQRTVRILGRMIEDTTGDAAYDITHNLVTLCMHAKPVFAFPDESIPLQISARALPQCEPVMESDVAQLHRLIDTGIVAGMAVSTPNGHHQLIDLLIRHFPESVRVVRHSDGRPAAFTTFLPLYHEVISVLPKATVEALQERMGAELSRYERLSLAETDTLLSLITTVPLEPQEFTFFDLLLAIKLSGWMELAQGKRCLLFSSVPEVKAFHAQLGYEYMYPQGIQPHPVDVYALDFRRRLMGKWLVALLLNIKTTPSQLGGEMSKELLRDALKDLQHPSLLRQSELAKVMELPADELAAMLLSVLTETTPRKPLTAMLQSILRLSYVEGKNVVAIADELNIGRTTYYRYLEKALSALVQVIEMEHDDVL